MRSSQQSFELMRALQPQGIAFLVLKIEVLLKYCINSLANMNQFI